MAATVGKEKVSSNEQGLIRVDGVAVFRVEVVNGVIFVEIIDRDKMRAQCRGAKFVQIPLDDLVARIKEVTNNEHTAE